MPVVLQWLVGVAAGLTALGVIWTKFLRPVIKGANVIADAAPVLLQIAEEFKPNSGGSLHDTITRMDETLTLRTEVIERIDVDLHQHIEDDREALKVTRAAAETAVAVALDLKVETKAIADALQVKTEETAAALAAKPPDALP